MITKYQKDNLEEVINLGNSLNPKFNELFNIENLSDKEMIYLYKEDDKVIGFIHVLNNFDEIEILNLVVNETRRHEGIGSLLLDYLLGIDSKRIILEVREDNEAAIRLYSKFNFIIINKRSGYYSGIDALVMERSNN